MSALTIRLPKPQHKHLKNAAEADGISVNQFISLAVAKKLSALQTYDLIAKMAEWGSRDKFLDTLGAVLEAPPVPGDELPPGYQRR